MVTTNDNIILWWLTNKKQTPTKTFWLATSLLPWWKKVMYPQNDVHTSEDITYKKWLTKIPLTLNFFWVVYLKMYYPCFSLFQWHFQNKKIWRFDVTVFFSAQKEFMTGPINN